MGSGASTEKDTLKPLLLSQELVDGSAALVSDFPFRVSFTNYIKSGVWLDRLSRLVPEPQLGSIGVAGAGSVGVAKQSDKSFATNVSSHSEMSPKAPLNSSTSTVVNGYAELSSGKAGSFPPEELLVILFTIVYPIYLSSPEYERFVKYGIEQGNSVQDGNSNRSVISIINPHGTSMVQTNSSKRAQELLLSCAAHYDEFFLQEFLQEAAWLQRVCSIFRDHTLALCITDATKDGLPILFANKAFCRLFGYTESELVANEFSKLSGPDTEMPQLQLMHSSIHSTEIVKFSITLQSKAKKPLLDLVAQKAVGAYSVSAHFVATKSAQPEVLNMADDVLLFLSYLVRAPALPAVTPPSWLPTPIAILAQAASNVLQGASPSSARSHSSSIRRGHLGRTAKGGKGGTPTSVRSFNSGLRSNSGGSSGRDSYRSARDGTGRFQRPPRAAETSGPRSVRSGGASIGEQMVPVVPEEAVETVLEDVEPPLN